MPSGFLTAAYIAASILFILSLGGLSHQERARRGNIYGIAGMAIAIVATVSSDQVSNLGLVMVLMLIGASAGIYVALKVQMTEMPELVAILHSFVGLAADAFKMAENTRDRLLGQRTHGSHHLIPQTLLSRSAAFFQAIVLYFQNDHRQSVGHAGKICRQSLLVSVHGHQGFALIGIECWLVADSSQQGPTLGELILLSLEQALEFLPQLLFAAEEVGPQLFFTHHPQ